MRDDVLFEITKDHLNSGMRKIPIGFCSTSYIDPKKGLFYAGRNLKELVQYDPLKVIFLLYNGWEGVQSEIDSFLEDIKRRSFLSEEVLYNIKSLPKKCSAIETFASSLFILRAHEKTNDLKEDCLNIIAKLPLLCASVINFLEGKENKECHNRGYLENFIDILNIDNVNKDQFQSVLNIYSILQFDHGGGSLETFIGKTAASSSQSLYYSLATAVLSMGNLNGYSAKNAFEFISSLSQEKVINDEELAKILKDKLERSEKIYGFGHPVFDVEDPRACILYDYAQKHFSESVLIKNAFALRSVGKRVLMDFDKINNPNPNIDAIAGVLFSASSFRYPEYFSLLFAMSRLVGCAIQILDDNVSTNKKNRFVSPHYFYRRK
jgi:citrate synthase